MIIFITNTEAINKSLNYISLKQPIAYNDDFMLGLDGVLTDEDRRMMIYAEKYGEPGSSSH